MSARREWDPQFPLMGRLEALFESNSHGALQCFTRLDAFDRSGALACPLRENP